MTMFPVGFDMVLEVTRARAQSALPHAPVRADDPAGHDPHHVRGPARTRMRTRVRSATAAALRTLATRATRAAERIEPAC
jgi:hypothetical protein